jgi:hypothetical protein
VSLSVANFQQQEIGTPIYAREIRESLVQPRPFLVGHTPFYLHILLSRQNVAKSLRSRDEVWSLAAKFGTLA